MREWPKKDPSDVSDYSLNWDLSPSSDTVSTSSWSVTPATITISADSRDGNITTVWLTGGVAGVKYTFTNQITTSGGRTYEQSVRLYVANK